MLVVVLEPIATMAVAGDALMVKSGVDAFTVKETAEEVLVPKAGSPE